MANFLSNNMEETDMETNFKITVTPQMLKWQLQAPKQIKSWHFGVIATAQPGKKKRIMGMITGTPRKMQINKSVVKVCNVNFLCVHKKLRERR